MAKTEAAAESASGGDKTKPSDGRSKLTPRDQLYISENENTFQNDEKLPSLPVPDLKDTLEKYLDSVSCVVDREEFESTEKLVREFETGPGPILQEKLQQRAVEKRNWLEEWWLEYAYLRTRQPLIPYSNMAGPLPSFDFWPPQVGTRIERTALSIYSNLSFWKLLRDAKMRPMVNKGVPWSMDQFKKLFNSVRTPANPMDELHIPFRTKGEGPAAPTNIIVLYRGYIFSFEAVDRVDEEPYTPQEIAYQLDYIEKWCNSQSQDGPGISSLTLGDRDAWASNRRHLITLHADNEKALEKIENSLMVQVLEDSEPVSSQDLLKEAMTGDCTNRWADKSIMSIAFRNGTFSALADHTPFDGLATAILTHYSMMTITECKGVWKGPNTFRDMPKPQLIEFHIDDKIHREISSARAQYRKNCEDIEVLVQAFEDYGKSILQSHRFHPEAYIQIALQLAYYRMHGKPAPTYVTASTRKFYHGRTETCRSCFPESVEFAKAVVAGQSTPGELYSLLQRAVKKFQRLMGEAMDGKGVDRHMLGLYLVSLEEGMELPGIFTDSAFIKSGGAGNYILSTSCAGYWNLTGGVPPMRPDGYGCFYGIEDNKITFACLAMKSYPETNSEVYFKNICASLRDMQNILNASKL